MPPSQKHIAERLNLSMATVSRSLAADPAISAATRARVVEVAAELGYRSPSRRAAGASAGAGSDRLQVGVLLQSGRGEQYSDQRMSLLEGMTVAAREAGVQLVIDTLLPGDAERLREDPSELPLLTGPAAPPGLLVWQTLPADALARLISCRPCVLLNNHHLVGQRVDSVGPNHFDAIIQLVEHLYEAGHRRIGYFGPLRQHVWGAQREGAFLAGMTKVGFRPSDAVVVDADDHGADHRLVDLTRTSVTAWVAASEPETHRLFKVLGSAGLCVPTDVSVVGYHVHDHTVGQMQVTTTIAPWLEIGRHAVRRLLDRLRNPAEPGRRVMLDCAFSGGASVASPRSR